RLALLLRLADAGDHEQAGLERGQRPPRHRLVALAEVLAALGVADDRAVDAELEQHSGGDLAGVGALVRPVDVLRGDRDLGVRQRRDRGPERGEWRADGHVDTAEVAEPLLQRAAELARLR